MWFPNYGDSTLGSITTGATIGAPMVTDNSPTSGAAGQSVTINGLDLEGATAVKFKGASASITSDTFSRITVAVPAGAATGKLKVITPGGKAKTAASFVVN
jgi:hypothetical protein